MCKCCFGNIEGESCGWPRGTVRSIIALITIPLSFISAIGIMIALIVKEQYLVAVGINSVIFGVIGTIIGYYYGTKSAEGAAKLISDTEHEILRSVGNNNINRNINNNNTEYIPIPNNRDNMEEVI
jgi:hypothetical protein